MHTLRKSLALWMLLSTSKTLMLLILLLFVYHNLVETLLKQVDFICDAPEVRAISFVGSNTAGEYIHARGSANGTRVQANLGAKNHGVIMPGTC
jgi:acyl-CoA reductase-like NAD-dependent aldehyde dehydrogenase